MSGAVADGWRDLVLLDRRPLEPMDPQEAIRRLCALTERPQEGTGSHASEAER